MLDLNFVAGNVANYLKLHEVDSLHFPVPVNFIFVGFEGSGNQGSYFLFELIMFETIVIRSFINIGIP